MGNGGQKSRLDLTRRQSVVIGRPRHLDLVVPGQRVAIGNHCRF